MTETRLADLIVPSIWRPYMIQTSTELDLFIQSGVAVDVNDILEDFGKTINMPFFNDIDGSDNVSDDSTDITVNAITTGQDISTKLMRDMAFGATDLSSEISGADPMAAIASRIGAYWTRRRQAALLASLKGQFTATSSGTNVLDITGLAAGACELDAESFIDATHVLGDHNSALRAVAIHSDTEKSMKKQDLIDFIKPSTGGEPIPYYQGKRVIVDDTMPKEDLGGGVMGYTSYIFGPGAVAYASRPRRNPVEVGRDPLKNGGREYIVTREQWVMHVRGIKWVGTPAGPTATNAELATGTNWTRVYDPKNIRVVKFKHKLAS